MNAFILVVLAALAVMSKVANGMTYDEVAGEIVEYLQKEFPESYNLNRPRKSSLCNSNNCCTVTDSQSCPITALPKDVTSLVYPGGKTRCIFSDSTDFSFQVIPGDSDKLLFYFQGGGACFNEISTVKVPLCSTDAAPSSMKGAFDRTNNLNPYKSYTIVNVLYCSGDVHGGDTVRPYNDSQGVPVVQAGIANGQSALDWVLAQMKNGGLATELSSLVLSGSSAGSLGVQLWSDAILNAIPSKESAVLPDSYAGIFPDGSMGPLIYDYGFCKSGFLSADNLAKCNAKTLSLPDIVVQNAQRNPSIPIGFVQSKTDSVQILFYMAVGLSTRSSQPVIGPTEFYNKVNDLFSYYTATTPNFLTYLVDGAQHTFYPNTNFYTADAAGPKDNGTNNEDVVLTTWLNQFPLSSGQSAHTVCQGDLNLASKTGNIRTGKVYRKAYGLEDNNYCVSEVYPHEFTA